MTKVTVVGAGNVGATCANVLAHMDILKHVHLLDIQGSLAQGKALDTWQQAPIDSYSTYLTGSDKYEDTAGSDIVVITAGIPRKPGMSRDDLVATNAKIVASVTENILKYSPNPIIIIVSNPLDVMTYLVTLTSARNNRFRWARQTCPLVPEDIAGICLEQCSGDKSCGKNEKCVSRQINAPFEYFK